MYCTINVRVPSHWAVLPDVLRLFRQFVFLKGTVSRDVIGFFITYDIKSVLSAWALMVYKFFHVVVVLIF
jgi:hypothetical protein